MVKTLILILVTIALLAQAPAPPSTPSVCGGGVTILLNGQTLTNAINGCVLNLVTGSGIIESAIPNSSINGTVITFSYNPVLIPTHDTIHNNENYCISSNGTVGYTCSLPNKTLVNGYSPGMLFLLNVDTTCATSCTLNIDSNGPKTITQNDGITPPNSILIAGQAKLIWYDGIVFRLV